MDAVWAGVAVVVVILPALALARVFSRIWRPDTWLVWSLTVAGWAAGTALFAYIAGRIDLDLSVPLVAFFGLVASIMGVRGELQRADAADLATQQDVDAGAQ